MVSPPTPVAFSGLSVASVQVIAYPITNISIVVLLSLLQAHPVLLYLVSCLLNLYSKLADLGVGVRYLQFLRHPLPLLYV